MHHFTLEQLQALCPSVDSSVIKDFYGRMDPEYFSQFSSPDIAQHLELVNTLTPKTPCAIHIRKSGTNTHQLTIVAFDYFSEFATVCGVLSTFGLDIREAYIFTFSDRPASSPSNILSRPSIGTYPAWPPKHPSRHPGLSRKKVVDVFQVQVLPEFTFGSEQQTTLKQEITNLLRLLDAKQTREVRSQVNRQLIETLGKRKQVFSDLIHPVEISFNNETDPNDTIIDIHATDSPAFLFTFSNALTMRGLYISKAKIEVDGTRVRNRFYVKGRQGKKLKDRQEQDELRVAAALIKEFTHYLNWAPDPGKALNHFDLFLDQLLEEQPTKAEISWLNKKENLTVLAQLLGASDFLWEDFLRRQHTNLMPILKDFQTEQDRQTKTSLLRGLHLDLRQAKKPEDRKIILNRFKDRELFRIDMDHLLRGSSLPEFSAALTLLAEVIIEQALLEARRTIGQKLKRAKQAAYESIPISICGLGKLGGEELGYASDIEILCIYGNNRPETAKFQPDATEYFERLVQELLGWIEAKQEGIFHIDTRLRPHGEKGLLANSLAEIQDYYSPAGQAAPFERQALIKLRHIAGDPSLGQLVERHRDAFVYSRTPWPLATALHLRERQIKELVPSGTIHVKYSPGGLIDVEYTVQYLQILHGHSDNSLHSPNTIQTIHSLQRLGYLSETEGTILEDDYIFIRRVIDALRIVRGNAQDLLLPESGSDSMIFLSRRLGLRTENWQEGAMNLEKDIHRRMARVRKIFLEKFMGSSTSSIKEQKQERPSKRGKGR